VRETACGTAEVDDYFLCSLFQKILNASTSIGCLTVCKAVNFKNPMRLASILASAAGARKAPRLTVNVKG